MSTENIFKVIFHNQGKIYEIFAREVYQSDMAGFVIIEQMMFSQHSSVVVDPGEEKLKTEFESVKRCYIPMHAIVRIDEVEKQGVAKIIDSDQKVTPFPNSIYSTQTETE